MSRFQECWVIEYDEYGEPDDVSGYSEIADLGEIKLCYSMLVDGMYPEMEELFEEWILDQQEGFQTSFYVFPSSDCFKTKAEAKKAFKELKGWNNRSAQI